MTNEAAENRSGAGQIEVERWSRSQVFVALTNHTTEVVESIVMNDDAIGELIDVLQRVRSGDLPAATIIVDALGESI